MHWRTQQERPDKPMHTSLTPDTQPSDDNHSKKCIPTHPPCKHCTGGCRCQAPNYQTEQNTCSREARAKSRRGMRELRQYQNGKTRSRRGLEFKRHRPVTDVPFRHVRIATMGDSSAAARPPINPDVRLPDDTSKKLHPSHPPLQTLCTGGG